MKLGVATVIFENIQGGNLSIKELEMIENSGINYIEITTKRVEGIDIFDYQDRIYVKQIAEDIQSLGMSVNSFHTCFGATINCDISAVDEKRRKIAVENMKASIDTSMALGSDIIVIHPGGEISSEDRAYRTQKVEKSIKEILEYCKGKTIKVALENLPDFCIGGSCKEVVKLVNKIDSKQLGICLDTGHVNSNGENLVDSVRLIGNRLLNLHIHDNNGKEDEHIMPFDGTINWFDFGDALKQIGFDGGFIYELTGKLLFQKDPEDILKKVKETFNMIFK